MHKSRVILLLLLILNLALIWGNSVLDGQHSNAISDPITERIEDAVDQWEKENFPAEQESDVAQIMGTLVRKGAHLTEFFCLGVILTMLLGARSATQLALTLLGGMSTALIDETIQIFSGRTSRVADIWIDLAGFVAGCLIVLAVRRICRVVQGNGGSRAVSTVTE